MGAAIKEKGIIEVIEIAGALPNYECLIVCEPKMYGNITKNELENVKIPHNLKILGQLKHEAICELYSQSLFSVCLIDIKIINEIFGKSAIESQLCGYQLFILIMQD